MRLPNHKPQRLAHGVYVNLDGPAPNNVRRLNMGALRLVDSMHHWGMHVSIPRLQTLSRELEVEMERLSDEIESLVGRRINPRSPKELSELLFKELRVQGSQFIKLTDSGGPSTDSDQLNMFKSAHPVVEVVLDWKELATIKSTFADALPKKADSDSRIHTEISAVKARTGRYASKNPNMQNIPTRSAWGKRVRQCFTASPGWKLCAADLSQIEMRWMAHASGEPVMVEGYRNPKWDVHTQTAMDISGKGKGEITPEFRAQSKPVGFGVLYLIGPEGLQTAVLEAADVLWPLDHCADVIERFYAARPYIRKWQELQFKRARQYRMVWDAFGNIRPIPFTRSRLKWIKAEGERQAANMPIQGGATGSIKMSMLICYDQLEKVNRKETLVKPLLQVHDELIWEVREDFVEEWREMQRPIMQDACPLDVPVQSSFAVADDWAGLK